MNIRQKLKERTYFIPKKLQRDPYEWPNGAEGWDKLDLWPSVTTPFIGPVMDDVNGMKK